MIVIPSTKMIDEVDILYGSNSRKYKLMILIAGVNAFKVKPMWVPMQITSKITSIFKFQYKYIVFWVIFHFTTDRLSQNWMFNVLFS